MQRRVSILPSSIKHICNILKSTFTLSSATLVAPEPSQLPCCKDAAYIAKDDCCQSRLAGTHEAHC